MANSEKISEIIDPAAFKQLEDLLKDLGIIQKTFVGLTGDVANFNSEISKSKSIGEFSKATEAAAAATAKVVKAQEEQVVQAKKVVEVEKQIVEATKQKILVNVQDDKVLKQVNGGLDQQIRRQLQLKLELAAVKEQQQLLNNTTASSAESVKSLSNRLAGLVKDEALLKNAIQQNNLEIRRSVREQNAAEGSSDALAARLDQLRGAFRSLNAEERENAQIGGVLEAQIVALADELAALDARQKVYNRNVGNYTSALAGMGGPIGNIIGQFGSLVEVSEKINENIENPEGFRIFTEGLKSITRAAWAFIATPIGATIAGITAALLAAKGWYDYNKGLVEATRLTKQFTGLSGDDLKSFRTEVQATATVFDKDFKEVIIASNAVAKQFGISQSESIDLIRKGFVAGADANSEFLDQLREYPTLLKEVGLSAEETISIITQNVKDGIYSDKGIDAIKEAGLSLREMTKATALALDGIGLSSVGIQKELTEGTTTVFEVIQRVSNRLAELPSQSTQVGTAIADIFKGAGEDAGLDYIKTLGQINTNLDETVKKAGAVAEAELKQLEATEKLDKTFAALFDVTGGGFELLLANTKLYATNFAIGVLENLVKAINYTVEFYNASETLRGVIQTIGLSFKATFDIISAMYSFIFENTKSIAQLFKAAFTGNFDEIGSILVTAGKKNVKIARDVGKDLANGLSDAYINTLTGRLSKVTLGLDTTGASNVAGTRSSGPTGGDFVPKGNAAADKKAAEQEKKRVQAELALATYRATTMAEIAKREAENIGMSYDDRIIASERWVEEQEKVLAAQRDQELQAAQFPAERALAEEKYTNELSKLKKEQGAIIGKAFEDELNNIKLRISEEDRLRLEQASRENEALKNSENDATLLLTKRFLDGEITQKEFQQRRLDLQSSFSQQYIQQEIEEVQRLIEVNKIRGIDVAQQERDLAALRLKLSKDVTDKQISDQEKLLEREKEINEARQELTQELGNLAFGLIDARFERQQQEVEQQLENLDKQTQAEINAVNQSTLTEEQKTIRIAQIEAKAQVQREQLEARQRQIQLKQAKFDRAQQVAGIILNTARAVTAALPNIPLSILVGAIGAAQLGTALAAPLPRFFTGTESSPEGFAHVGEKGTELMVDPRGNLMMTPNRDTVTYLEKGTQIFDAAKTRNIMANASMSGAKEMSTFVNYTVDIDKMVKATKDSTRELKEAFNKRPEHRTILTKSGLRSMVTRGNKWIDYKNRNIR